MNFIKKCKTSLQQKKACAHMMEISEKRPLDINIETTNSCVLKCKFCYNRHFPRKKQVMDMDFFKKICMNYREIGGGYIGITSMHADLLTDPLLIERLKFLADFRDEIQLTTTSPMLLLNQYSDAELLLFLESFSCLQISILGHDEESYYNMAGISGFDKVKNNLNRVYLIANEYNLLNNIHLYFRTYDIDLLKNTDFFNEMSNKFHIMEIMDTYFSWFGAVTQADLPLGAKIHAPLLSEDKENCVIPRATLSVEVDGTSVACSCMDYKKEYPTGNLHENSLLEIWNSDVYKNFRDGFSSSLIPKMCQNCGLYIPAKTVFSNVRLVNYKPQDGIYYML